MFEFLFPNMSPLKKLILIQMILDAQKKKKESERAAAEAAALKEVED